MPIKITVMGTSDERVTSGIDAEFRGAKIEFAQRTFSVEVGSQLNLTLNARMEGSPLTVGEQGELLPTPDGLCVPGTTQSLYKIDPEKN